MGEKPIRSDLERAEHELSDTIGRGHLIGFRDDLEKIWVKNREEKSWDHNSMQLAKDVNRSMQHPRRALRTFDDIFSKVTVFDGLTGGGLGFLMYWGLTTFGVSSVPAAIPAVFVFLFFTAINHGILYTGAFFNHVCYKDASPREEDSRLLFKRGWNSKVLMSSRSVLGIFVAGLFRATWRGAYEVGLEVVEDLDKRKNC